MTRDLIIGTYTQELDHVRGHADGVLAARFDGSAVGDVTVAARVTNPSWVAVSADRSRVYAVGESAPEGTVEAFAREGSALTPLGSAPAGGAEPAHVALHPSRPFLITGTYGSGTVSVFALRGDGSLGQRTGFVQHEGRGPVEGRQDAPHVHQLSIDPVTGDVVVVDLGLGEVRWYALGDDGSLEPRPEATVSVGASGPRHLLFHPDGRHILLVNELDSTLDVLRRDGDRFVRVGGASTRGSEAEGDSTAGAIALSHDGRTVLTTNRGDDTIAVFSFDPEVSRVALAEVVPVRGRTPRDLVVSPEGDRVLAACQDSDEVTVFAFDERARTLRFVGSSPVPTPVCLVFV